MYLKLAEIPLKIDAGSITEILVKEIGYLFTFSTGKHFECINMEDIFDYVIDFVRKYPDWRLISVLGDRAEIILPDRIVYIDASGNVLETTKVYKSFSINDKMETIIEHIDRNKYIKDKDSFIELVQTLYDKKIKFHIFFDGFIKPIRIVFGGTSVYDPVDAKFYTRIINEVSSKFLVIDDNRYPGAKIRDFIKANGTYYLNYDGNVYEVGKNGKYFTVKGYRATVRDGVVVFFKDIYRKKFVVKTFDEDIIKIRYENGRKYIVKKNIILGSTPTLEITSPTQFFVV